MQGMAHDPALHSNLNDKTTFSPTYSRHFFHTTEMQHFLNLHNPIAGEEQIHLGGVQVSQFISSCSTQGTKVEEFPFERLPLDSASPAVTAQAGTTEQPMLQTPQDKKCPGLHREGQATDQQALSLLHFQAKPVSPTGPELLGINSLPVFQQGV